MRVGTRKHTITLVNGNKDHPHACGDKKDTVNDEIRDEGSSPCVWGQAGAHGLKTTSGRIIPMRVGTRMR